MIACFKEGAQDRIALRRVFQADLFKVAMENPLGLADHLAGESGLIIDTVLQHNRREMKGQNSIPILKMKFIFSSVPSPLELEYNQKTP